MKNAYKKIGSWIAIFAMLLTSFMPLNSHAVELKNNLHNVERVCTSQGIKFVSTQNQNSDKNHAGILVHQSKFPLEKHSSQRIHTIYRLTEFHLFGMHSQFFYR